MPKVKITMKRAIPQIMTAEIELTPEQAAQLKENPGQAKLWASQQAPLHGGVWSEVGRGWNVDVAVEFEDA